MAAQIKAEGTPLNQDSYQILAEPSSYVPPTFFILETPDLFGGIIMNYMMKAKNV
jgi:hypothetical protein